METTERNKGMGLGSVPFRVLAEEKREAHGLEAKILPHAPLGSAAVVTLVEKKVDRLVDRIQALGYVRNVGDFHETSRKPEQVPRPAEFFFDGILAGQEGVGDFRNAETAKRLEDECHLDFC